MTIEPTDATMLYFCSELRFHIEILSSCGDGTEAKMTDPDKGSEVDTTERVEDSGEGLAAKRHIEELEDVGFSIVGRGFG
ncbi:hypothetical protein HYC85_007762 [Camellia sinensis]|uniref:Uncharacterized protein n=1 Tax=Camellia sinensis TaxID=4442 RepID=A0A7J7HS78_CAMSI|nr:hypothetical protein HYC85_007762 [Camellia sinensis]